MASAAIVMPTVVAAAAKAMPAAIVAVAKDLVFAGRRDSALAPSSSEGVCVDE